MPSIDEILERYRSESVELALQGATDLATCDLSTLPKHWEAILLRLAALPASVPRLELALAQLGHPLMPVLEKVLFETPVDTVAPILRVLNLLAGSGALEHYRHFSTTGSPSAAVALWCLAHYEPSEVVAILHDIFPTGVSEDPEALHPYIDACILTAMPETLTFVRQWAAQRPSVLYDYDSLDTDRRTRLLEFAQEHLLQHLRGHADPAWPNTDLFVLSALAALGSQESRDYLLQLSSASEWWLQREEILQLVSMNDASASGLLRKHCCGDKGIAEAAIAFASKGPSTLLYDLCSSAVEQNATLLIQHTESPFETIWKGILRLAPESNDPRWSSLADAITATEPIRASALKHALLTDSSVRFKDSLALLDEHDDKKRHENLMRLAEQGNREVLGWIQGKIDSGCSISRDEYFNWIEALRVLQLKEGCKVVELLMERCSFSGFAREFAEETMEHLSPSLSE